MADRDDQWRVEDVLAHAAWIRGLARRLVTDAARRDDIVQDAWIEALQHGPRARSARAWLTAVLRNVVRMDRRGDARRRAREAGSETPAPPLMPEQLVERVEIEREVAGGLLDLPEPYRSTLLWHYYEDIPAAEIARRSNVPPGTVRWRMKHGLELLRDELDARFNGNRRRWNLALIPTAAAARVGRKKLIAAIIGGLLIMKATTKLAGGVALALLLLAGGAALWSHRASPPREVSRAQPGVAWRVAGGIGGTTASPPTIAGVALPSWFGQRGAPLRHVAGRVTFAGAPVANATVELASDLTDAGVVPRATRRTSADGRFDFGTQPPAKLTVAASADGHSPAIVETDTRNPTSGSEHIELRLGGCESQLFGHVSDSSGGPIAAARVCLAPPRPIACVSTDSAGAYKQCLSPHQSLVTVAAVGYGAIYDHFDYTGRRVQRDYALTPEAVIVGRVVRADTNAPVAQAQVRTVARQHALRFVAPAATTTNERGRFSIAGLAAGRHRIVAFAEGLAASEAIEVSVTPGRTSGEVVLRLLPAARVSGKVTDGNQPIAGATVKLGFGPGITPVDGVTQADGSFVIDPIARGVAMVSVEDYEVRAPKTINIDRADVSDVEIVVDNLGSLAGRVTFQGKPLGGARVSVNMGRDSADADADGSYILHGLRAGHYHLAAEDPVSRAFGWGPDLTLEKGEHKTGADVAITSTAKISGIVVEPDGKPVSGASVLFEMVSFNDMGQDVTSPDGTFCARNLMGGGDYRVRVSTAAGASVQLKLAPESPAVVNVKDPTAEVSGVRLVVQRDHLAISGSTVDGDGQPFSDVNVVAFRADDAAGMTLDDWFAHPSAISAGDGSWSIGELDSATYTLRARAGDGSEGIVRGVSAGQKSVVLTLQRSGTIAGTLVGFSTPPAVGAVRQVGMSFTRVFATISGNSFSFDGLSPGTYQVAAIGAEDDAKAVDVVSGQTATVTLQSRGTTTIHGRAVDFQSGNGASGLQCTIGLRSSTALPVLVSSVVGFSDDSGAFTLLGAPTGDVSVLCHPATPYWTDGRVNLTLTAGQDASCVVPVVKSDPDAPNPMMMVGAVLDPTLMPAQFNVVTPHGAADRAGIKPGDIISAVQGADVGQLTPWGVMTLIGQAASSVRLTLSHAGQSTNATLLFGQR